MSLGQILQIEANFDLVTSLLVGGMTHSVKQTVALQWSSKFSASKLVANKKIVTVEKAKKNTNANF